jgi:uncharacterized protein YbjQ (UPF0145 family)
MKRKMSVVAMLLVVVMCVSLVGCSQSKPAETSASQPQSQTSSIVPENYPEKNIEIINAFSPGTPHEAYLRLMMEWIAKEYNLKNKFNTFINQIPVITVDNPTNLTIIKYCGVITAQSIVETGNIEEFINNDVYRHSESEFEYKLGLGEKSCVNTLRKQALKYGANAVIGMDINYAELSTSKDMFLIAMMGTSVIVEEFEILDEYEQNIYNKLTISH